MLLSDEVKSIGGLYDLVIRAQPDHVIDGNYQGSLLTMTSQQGILFGIILLVSNFGAVIVSIIMLMIEYSLTLYRWTLDTSRKHSLHHQEVFYQAMLPEEYFTSASHGLLGLSWECPL